MLSMTGSRRICLQSFYEILQYCTIAHLYPTFVLPFTPKPNYILMKGCLNASAGVILFSGFNSKHRPRKSTKLDNNAASPSGTVPPPVTLCFKSLIGFCKFNGFNHLILRCGIDFLRHKHQLIVEMDWYVLSFSKHLARETTTTFNHETKHLIVRSAGKEDFSGV